MVPSLAIVAEFMVTTRPGRRKSIITGLVYAALSCGPYAVFLAPVIVIAIARIISTRQIADRMPPLILLFILSIVILYPLDIPSTKRET
jgi:hypothetical protein